MARWLEGIAVSPTKKLRSVSAAQNTPLSWIGREPGSGARQCRSMGTTDSEGRYRLTTEGQEAGARVGKHKVIVEDLAIYEAPRAADGTVLEMPAARFAAHYGDPLRSPLEIEVTGGAQTVNLDLQP